MMKVIGLAIAAAAAAAAGGCSKAQSQEGEGGPTVERNYPVGAFERIALAGAYDVTVRTGANPSVQAHGSQQSIERLVVEVHGNTLRIHPEKRSGMSFNWGSPSKVMLTVTVPRLSAAELGGSGGMRIDRVVGDSFEGAVAGSGDLRIGEVQVARLRMGISGSGQAEARGRAQQAQYDIAGSGGINARNVAAETAAVSIAGSGEVTAHATRSAKVDIAGSGDVEIVGGAKCTVSKAGSGNVRCG
jgi:hypothetical protein